MVEDDFAKIILFMPAGATMNTVLTFGETSDLKIPWLGGKGYSLVELHKNSFNVPLGFIITSSAFSSFLDHNSLNKYLEIQLSKVEYDVFEERSYTIKNAILQAEVPFNLMRQIEQELDRLGSAFVSIRSSAVGEDSPGASFAGLHDSFLNIAAKLETVLAFVKKCWASAFNERAMMYRQIKALPFFEGMAVIVQKMVNADISGITFTVSPTSEQGILIEASYGLGDLLVGGEIEPDHFILDRETLAIKSKKLGTKAQKTIIRGERTTIAPVELEFANSQALSDEKIREIGKVCMDVENLFHHPQDIEWCLQRGRIWVLQSRPITRARL